MLKGIEFLLKKSRGKVEGGKELSSPAPVILGRDAQSVPKILWQQVSKLVNKFALLLKRSMLKQDSRYKTWNDGGGVRWFSVCCMFLKQMYHSGSSANELALKAKDDVSGWYWRRWFSVFSTSALSVILRRYSLPEAPGRRIHNVIANAMSICVA